MTEKEKIEGLKKQIDDIYSAVYGEEESFKYVDSEGSIQLRGKYSLLKDIKEKFNE